jgi:para-nitrobenzyl esterase
MKLIYLAVLGALLLVGACTTKEPGISTTVNIDSGQIAGVQDSLSGVISFKGIPFAAPPMGELRWKAPQPVEAWEGTRNCTDYGPSPMQADPAPFMFWSEEFLIPKEPIGEDCLYLNVWTGARAETDKLPVLVYIYGGGFSSGGSGCAIYDGTSMARKGVVFVSINYRVGVFGFLAHPQLSAESEHGTSGNYGILDMVSALQWVRRNIERFGGDPGNVTIAGQSAGSFAVNYLTVSPLAGGLFHRAIAESGAAFVSSPLRPALTLKEAEEAGVAFGEALGARSLDELRALPADSILKARGGIRAPFTDGYVLPEPVMDAYINGHQNDVPVMAGWNKDDRLIPLARPADQFREQVQVRFGELTDEFLKVYPAGTQEEASRSQFDMSRDETFGIQAYTWARIQSSSGGSPIYLYNFNRDLPAYTPETQFGAFHTGEVVYAYDNLHTLDRPWEEVDQEVATLMSSYWVNFARNGTPDGPGLPEWDAFNMQTQEALLIDTVTVQQTLPDLDQLKFWESYYLSMEE